MNDIKSSLHDILFENDSVIVVNTKPQSRKLPNGHAIAIIAANEKGNLIINASKNEQTSFIPLNELNQKDMERQAKQILAKETNFKTNQLTYIKRIICHHEAGESCIHIYMARNCKYDANNRSDTPNITTSITTQQAHKQIKSEIMKDSVSIISLKLFEENW